METTKKAVSKTDMITVEGLIKVKKQNIISIFSDNKKIEPMIKKVREEVSVEKFDLSTKKGRDDIASRAYKVSKMKNAVVKQLIDPSVEEYKAAIKGVGAGKSHWNTEMDNLRDEIRAPLNKWEEEEKVREQKRIDEIKKSISGIINLAVLPQGKEYDKIYISEMIEAVDNIDCSEGFYEFAQEALQAKASSKEALSQCLNTVIQKELEVAQQKELAEQQERLDNAQLVMKAKAKAQERLNKLIMIPSTMFGKTSVELNKKLNSIDLVEINEAEFGELFDQANVAKAQVIVQLGQMAENQALVEDAKAQQKQPEITQQQEQSIPVDNQHAQAGGLAPDITLKEESPVEQRLTERFKEKTVIEFLTEYNESQGFSTDIDCLIETLTEGSRVWNDPYMDEHRWYICNEVVNEIGGTFVKFTDYIITGDNGMADMDLSYDLDSASIVQKKERTVIETYYE